MMGREDDRPDPPIVSRLADVLAIPNAAERRRRLEVIHRIRAGRLDLANAGTNTRAKARAQADVDEVLAALAPLTGIPAAPAPAASTTVDILDDRGRRVGTRTIRDTPPQPRPRRDIDGPPEPEEPST